MEPAPLPTMKLIPLFLTLAVPAALPVQAGILDALTGYYSFETQTAGVVPNEARALGRPGYPSDGAVLLGGDPVAGGAVPLSSAAGTFLSGTAALACDGNADYADLASSPVTTSADFSMSVWCKPQTSGLGVTGSARLFVMESKPAYALSLGLRAGSAGNTNFQLFTDVVSGTDPSASFDIPHAEVDAWHHLVITWNAAGAMMLGYVDGVQTHAITPAAALSEISGINTGTYRSANGRWFRGFIDEQIFWQREISAQEVTALHAGGTAGTSFAALSARPENAALRTDLTAYYPYDSHVDRMVANAAVALGAPGFPGDAAQLVGDYTAGQATIPPLTNSAAESRAGSRALLCDGVNNFARIDGNPVDQSTDWTVSAWFRPDTGGAGYATSASRAFVYETGVNFPISLGLRGGASADSVNVQMFSLGADGTAFSRDYQVPSQEIDQWHHFIQTYDAATGEITGYLNGVLSHSLPVISGEAPLPLQTYAGFRIGTYRAADGRWFKGYIDEVAMWQRRLTVEDAQQVYALGKAGLPLTSGGADTSITAFMQAPGIPGAWRMAWTTVAGLRYTLEASSDLADWSTRLAEDIPATGSSMEFTIHPSLPVPPGGLYDPGAAGRSSRFYRVRLVP